MVLHHERRSVPRMSDRAFHGVALRMRTQPLFVARERFFTPLLTFVPVLAAGPPVLVDHG
jgi:hypothetical protein